MIRRCIIEYSYEYTVSKAHDEKSNDEDDDDADEDIHFDLTQRVNVVTAKAATLPLLLYARRRG